MSDFPDIIDTKIVTKEIDSSWDEKGDLNTLSARNLLIISQPITTNSEEETQLQKIVSACQLKEEDYNLLQIEESTHYAWTQIKSTIKPKVVLLFGVLPKELSVAALFLLNHPNNFDKAIWIPTLSLQELSQQPEAKKQLWANALKPLYIEK